MKESSCHAVMVYLYLKDMEDYTVVNKVYAKSFTSHYPARQVVTLLCRCVLGLKVVLGDPLTYWTLNW